MSNATSEKARLEVLLDAARCLGSEIDHLELLRSILQRAQVVMNAEASSVFIHDPATRELVMHAPGGSHADQMTSIRIPEDKGIAGSVFHSRRPDNVMDVAKDPRFFGAVDKKSGFVTRAILCVPLLHQGDCMGVLQVLNPKDGQPFDEEDTDYFTGFASLVASALMRMRADEQRALQRRIEQEMTLATEIQNSFLPTTMPTAACVRTAAHYQPALEVGGDFYHVEELEDGCVLVAVGDVSGKGFPAALTMARVTAEIRALSSQCGKLGEWVTKLNRRIARDLVAGRFIGITAILFDPKKGEAQVCCAGQYPPWRFEDGSWNPIGLPFQLALGILPDAVFDSQQFPLRPGDQWILFSDGVPEARNQAGDELGADKVAALIPHSSNLQELISGFAHNLKDFAGDAKPHDDATILLAQWRGAPPATEWHLPAIPSQLKIAREHVEKWALFAGFDDLTIGQIVLAADEAAANVIRYAYKEGEGPIHFAVSLKDNRFTLTMRDYGAPCDLAKVKGRELDDVRPGGLGTFFMATAFDQVEYIAQEKGTLLVLGRALPA